MSTTIAAITVELPVDKLRLMEDYARQHGISFGKLIENYGKMIEQMGDYQPSAKLREIVGVIPPDVDLEKIRADNHLEK